MARWTLLGLGLVWMGVLACDEGERGASIDIEDPATCMGCHPAITAEWQESMHARAHHENDPIYASLRTLWMDKSGADIAQRCAVCHTPREPTRGVTCASCHNVSEVHRGDSKLGNEALKPAPAGTLLGPHDVDPDASPVHGTGSAPSHMKEGSTLCLACHDAATNPQGVATCTTGQEAASVRNVETCTSCHMLTVAGVGTQGGASGAHRSHVFAGPHRAWYQQDPEFLRTSVALSGTFRVGKAEVQIANKTTHGFPTGFPGRVAVLRFTGLDAEGKEIWHSWTSNPMVEHPEAVFNKVYVDAEGKPTLPAFAASLKRDARLKPGETRTVTVEPPQTVHRVSVTLSFLLVPGPAAKKLGLEGTLEAEPRPIATLVLDRTD